MATHITIQNKIEVMYGNKIMVPGCEPTSAFTSPTLAENRDCSVTVVDLADALAAIPGSTVVYWSNPRKKFFVLPNGPAPNPDSCTTCVYTEDWYKKLREIGNNVKAEVPKHPFSVDDFCDIFPYNCNGIL